MKTPQSNSRQFYFVVAGLLLLLITSIFLLALINPDSTFGISKVPSNPASILIADYSIGDERAFIPAIQLAIVEDIFRNAGNLSDAEISARLEEFQNSLNIMEVKNRPINSIL